MGNESESPRCYEKGIIGTIGGAVRVRGNVKVKCQGA